MRVKLGIKCPACGGWLKCEKGSESRLVVCTKCARESYAACTVDWAVRNFWFLHGEPGKAPSVEKVVVIDDLDEDDEEVLVDEEIVAEPVVEVTDPIDGPVVEVTDPIGEPVTREKREKGIPPSGMMTCSQICELTNHLGEKRLKEKTLGNRIRSEFYNSSKDRYGRWLIPREEGVRIVDACERVSKMRSIAELSRSCGMNSASLNPIVIQGHIRATNFCGRWYVDDTEYERVVAFYSKLSRKQAATILGKSTGYVMNLIHEEGLRTYELHVGGERRYDKDELFVAMSERQERLRRHDAKPAE